MEYEKKPFDQIKYQNEYNKANYDQVLINIPKGEKARWKEMAKAEGLSLSAWILKQINTEEEINNGN